MVIKGSLHAPGRVDRAHCVIYISLEAKTIFINNSLLGCCILKGRLCKWILLLFIVQGAVRARSICIVSKFVIKNNLNNIVVL